MVRDPAILASGFSSRAYFQQYHTVFVHPYGVRASQCDGGGGERCELVAPFGRDREGVKRSVVPLWRDRGVSTFVKSYNTSLGPPSSLSSGPPPPPSLPPSLQAAPPRGPLWSTHSRAIALPSSTCRLLSTRACSPAAMRRGPSLCGGGVLNSVDAGMDSHFGAEE